MCGPRREQRRPDSSGPGCCSAACRRQAGWQCPSVPSTGASPDTLRASRRTSALHPAGRAGRLLPPTRSAACASFGPSFRSWSPHRRLGWTLKRSPSCLLVESRASPPGRTGETPVPPSYDYHAVAVLAGGSNRGFDFRHDAFQVLERLIDGKRIHFATQAFARFQRRFQKVAGDFLCQRVGDQPSTALLVLDPGRVRQRDPDGAPVDQELDVDRIGVAGGDGDYQSLIEAVHLLLGPAVGGSKVSEHKRLENTYQVIYRPAGLGANGWVSPTPLCAPGGEKVYAGNTAKPRSSFTQV